jgi:hypothetical protein
VLLREELEAEEEAKVIEEVKINRTHLDRTIRDSNLDITSKI